MWIARILKLSLNFFIPLKVGNVGTNGWCSFSAPLLNQLVYEARRGAGSLGTAVKKPLFNNSSSSGIMAAGQIWWNLQSLSTLVYNEQACHLWPAESMGSSVLPPRSPTGWAAKTFLTQRNMWGEVWGWVPSTDTSHQHAQLEILLHTHTHDSISQEARAWQGWCALLLSSKAVSGSTIDTNMLYLQDGLVKLIAVFLNVFSSSPPKESNST